MNRVPLTVLRSELLATHEGELPNFRKLHSMALNADLPSAMKIGERWFVTDLAAVAKHFGLKLKAAKPPAKPTTGRAPAAA